MHITINLCLLLILVTVAVAHNTNGNGNGNSVNSICNIPQLFSGLQIFTNARNTDGFVGSDDNGGGNRKKRTLPSNCGCTNIARVQLLSPKKVTLFDKTLCSACSNGLLPTPDSKYCKNNRFSLICLAVSFLPDCIGNIIIYTCCALVNPPTIIPPTPTSGHIGR